MTFKHSYFIIYIIQEIAPQSGNEEVFAMTIKRMTWEEISKQYPNMWVAVKNPIMSGPDIIEGDVVAIKSDTEICDYENEHDNEGLIFRRTMEDEWNGTIDTGFIITTV